MDGDAIHGWQALLVVKTSGEMYGRILSKLLPSMEGRIHQRNATYMLIERLVSGLQTLHGSLSAVIYIYL